jgi:hypothetical protein
VQILLHVADLTECFFYRAGCRRGCRANREGEQDRKGESRDRLAHGACLENELEVIQIAGKRRLAGTVTPGAAKNALVQTRSSAAVRMTRDERSHNAFYRFLPDVVARSPGRDTSATEDLQ